MKGRSLLAIGATAATMILAGFAFAQAPGSQPGTAADHRPPDPKASEKPGAAGAPAQGAPMGPGMMGQPGMMGPGQMGAGQMGAGQMGPGQMGPGQMGAGQMGPWMMGPGQMGAGQMGPGRMGYGMMGPGMMMGHGMMGHGMMTGRQGHHGSMMGPWGHGRRVYLSADDVKRIVDGQLAWQGLKRLKVGAVKVVDDDTVSADVVTKEGSLAVRLRVDRHSGRAVIAD